MFPLRLFQSAAIDALQVENHVICVAPTGSGKSLIYEHLSSTLKLKTLLVTPLVALARQQRERLMQTGVDTRLGMGDFSEGPPPGSGVWITSPEGLEFPARKGKLSAWKPDFLVVDECHCFWDWGDGFRPAFNQLPDLIREYQIPRSLWLTATLPREARKSLREQLPSPVVEIGSFDLPEKQRLEISRVPSSERATALRAWVQQREGAGLIFAPTRDSTNRIRRIFSGASKKTFVYHAGLCREERVAIERLIVKNEVEVIVSTSAFGMGMHFPNLTWVVLWQAPYSILSLAQIIGRVGRNTQAFSRALVLWDKDDFRALEWLTQAQNRESVRRRAQLREVYDFLSDIKCRKGALKSYFDASVSDSFCGQCDYCEGQKLPKA